MLLFADWSRSLILLKMELMDVPIEVKTKIAAAPIRTSSSEYSHVVTASRGRSFLPASHGSVPVRSDCRTIRSGCPSAQSLLLPGLRLLAVCSRRRVQLDQEGFSHRHSCRATPIR